MRNAAVVNRLLSSGPAGMPNGRLTGWPRKVLSAGSPYEGELSPEVTEGVAFSTSANAPNGPCS